MKIILSIILSAGICFCVFARTEKTENVIIKNKLGAGANAGYEFYSDSDINPETSFNVPLAVYSFEAEQNTFCRFYTDVSAGYRISKRTNDFSSDLFAEFDNEIRVYLPEKEVKAAKKDDGWVEDEENGDDEYFKDNEPSHRFFYSLMLPFGFHQYTPEEKNASSFSAYTADITGAFGVDNKITDIKKLSPWAKFERGYFITGFLSYRFSDKFDGYSPESLPFFIGAYGDYSKDLMSLSKNLNVKAYCRIALQTVDDAEIVLPAYYTRGKPYMGKWAELEYGISAAHDMFSKLNLLSTLEYKTVQLDDKNSNRINTVDFSFTANYYLRPYINIYGIFGAGAHLKEDDTEPVYHFKAGAEYTLDLLNR
ncbi:MAG TPA: hypothetical protein PLK90_07095 [Clostridiales bacterium]|nr:hypothetical protein [Clostridiales bacterium]HQP70150.1 hypothetical protein [Clostridiales bacterium]